MKKRIRVAILYGGRSAEYDVSILSAKNVCAALDKHSYPSVMIRISRTGRWSIRQRKKWTAFEPTRLPFVADVVFPVLHGPNGEDGTVQGFFRTLSIPFVGADVLGSAVGMDKDVQKRLLNHAGIATAKFLVIRRGESLPSAAIGARLGWPVFVKPANLGSSIGITKVWQPADLRGALQKAFRYDTKILVEEAIAGREIECSVLGNERPQVSSPGEVLPSHEFYTYEAKYGDDHGARLEIPAKLPRWIVKRIQQLAVKTFKTLECEGMARVDFFVTSRGRIFVNELNSIPGFTNISMYPKLWGASGIPYPELIDRLIQLAIERFEKEQRLKTAYET